MEAAERLMEHNQEHERTMTAFVRLAKVWASVESKEDKSKHEARVKELIAVGEKLKSAMAGKQSLSLDEWAEALNCGVKPKADLCKDVQQASRVRHDTLVRIEKKLLKAGGAGDF
jgi:hypothetical protein